MSWETVEEQIATEVCMAISNSDRCKFPVKKHFGVQATKAQSISLRCKLIGCIEKDSRLSVSEVQDHGTDFVIRFGGKYHLAFSVNAKGSDLKLKNSDGIPPRKTNRRTRRNP